MRYIIYLLLAANVIYVGWNLRLDTTVAQTRPLVSRMSAAAHTLVLLNEQAGNTAAQTDRKMSMKAGKNKGATADMDEKQETQNATAAVTAQAEPPNSRQIHICKVLGPFDKFAAAETVSARLVRMGLIPLLRSVDRQVVDDYWVYLPGQGQQYSAEVIQKLKENNISDYYVFDSKNYLVSLGTFKRIGLAKNKQAMLQRMGMDALIKQRYKPRAEHWLEMYAEGTYDERLASLGIETPGLQIKTDSCMSFASR